MGKRQQKGTQGAIRSASLASERKLIIQIAMATQKLTTLNDRNANSV
jgi:hypothetical protein